MERALEDPTREEGSKRRPTARREPSDVMTFLIKGCGTINSRLSACEAAAFVFDGKVDVVMRWD